MCFNVSFDGEITTRSGTLDELKVVVRNLKLFPEEGQENGTTNDRTQKTVWYLSLGYF